MRLYLFLFCLVALLLVPIVILDDEIDAHFSGEQGLENLRAYGGVAWIVGMGLIVSDLVLPVPSTAVIAALGMLYGPWLGGLIGGLASILAGMIAFAGCRMMGVRVQRYLVGEANLERLSRFYARFGLSAIALSRWMPLLPEALCCLAGMARMPAGAFLAALACGSLAMGFAFGWMGQAYLERPVAGLVVSALIPLAVWPVLHWFFRKRGAEPNPS
jgi:uncharacterized membrane protein YdjX (TVP38/TMEM64 family)